MKNKKYQNGKKFLSLKKKRKIARSFWKEVLSTLFNLIITFLKEYESFAEKNGMDNDKKNKSVWIKKNLFYELKKAGIHLPLFPPYLEKIIISILVDILVEIFENLKKDKN